MTAAGSAFDFFDIRHTICIGTGMRIKLWLSIQDCLTLVTKCAVMISDRPEEIIDIGDSIVVIVVLQHQVKYMWSTEDFLESIPLKHSLS